ncbi:MAG: Fe-S cluster assembly protein NifU [Planctomycetes bacterium]|nr:Fe-S cluster assembly protein NifU [Planctomycetota bacterium]
MWDYSKKVLEHFLNPRNAGEMAEPTVVADVGNIACGDALRLYLRIEDGIITDARFKTFGCASAIASSSVLTELVKGMSVDEAAGITDDDIVRELDGLPEAKMHCSVMGCEALAKALALYRGEKPAPEDSGRIVCRCFGITDNKIIRAIRDHDLTTVDQVTHYTKAGGGCGKCREEIAEIIRYTRADMAARAKRSSQSPPRTNLQRMQQIIQVIDDRIRPSLRLDGGDIELVDIEGTTVTVALRGRCAGCLAGAVTLRDVVQHTLREVVDAAIEVKEAP